MQEESLKVDIFRYVEQLVSNNKTLVIAIGAMILLGGLNGALLFTHEDSGSVALIVICAFSVPLMSRYWLANFHRLSSFKVTYTDEYSVEAIGMAPLIEPEHFHALPRSALRDPESPAPPMLLGEIRETASVFPVLQKQLQICEAAHSVLSCHDAANLLLLQEGLRAARMPETPVHILAPNRTTTQISV
ncbi:MAG: hypothetical protein AAF434_06655 [Pseudomonadota bacterium]